jgi:hypothetical protein
MNIGFYLTSQESFITQNSTALSLGGYPSSSLYSEAVNLAFSIDQYASTLECPITSSVSHLSIDNEIMEVTEIDSSGLEYDNNSVIYVNRGTNGTSAKLHAQGTTVYGINNNLFNTSLNSRMNQYRCLAIQNTSSSALKNVKIYIKQLPINFSNVNLGLEAPSAPLIYGTALGGTGLTINTSYSYANNYLAGRYLKIISSTSKNYNVSNLITSFDNATGIIAFSNAFPYNIVAGDKFIIFEPPVQRLTSGQNAPSNITFTNGYSLINALSINVNNRLSGSTLYPNECVYLWLQRQSYPNRESNTNNGFILTANWTT